MADEFAVTDVYHLPYLSPEDLVEQIATQSQQLVEGIEAVMLSNDFRGQEGPEGPEGPQGLPGVNAVPADDAIAAYINAAATASANAVQARIDSAMAKLRPAGTTKHDTGWVDCTVPEPYKAQGGKAPQVRRIGFDVTMRRGVSNAGMAAVGNFPAIQLPAGFFPPEDTKYLPMGSNLAANIGEAVVGTTGLISIRTNATLGTYYMCDALAWRMD